MSLFTRTAIPSDTCTPSVLQEDIPHRVQARTEYAPYTSITTGVNEYDAPTTLAGLDKALGARVTRHLLAENGEATLHVAAMVMREHAMFAKDSADLQTTLLVNIVKELASLSDDNYVVQKAHCEELLRRCTLASDYKQEVLRRLTPKDVLSSPFLVAVEMT